MTARRGALLPAARATVAALLVAGAWSQGAPVASAATPTTRYVATDGSDAGDCTVPTAPCESVQYAVDVAADGDTISLGAGTFAGPVAVAGKSLTISGTAHRTVVTRAPDGDPAFAFIGAAAVTDTLSDLAASVSADGPTVTLTRVSADADDPYANPGEPYPGSEQAALGVSSGVVHVTRSNLGGAQVGVLVTGGGVDVADSDIAGGVGIDVSGGALTLSDSSVSAVEYEVGNEGGRLRISSSTLTGGDYAGIVQSGGTTIMDGSAITGAGLFEDDYQSAVLLVGGALTIRRSTIDRNVDGIEVRPDGSGTPVLTLTDSTVSRSGEYGLYVDGGTARVRTSTFWGNARQGIVTAAGGHTTITASTITNTGDHAAVDLGYRAGGVVSAPKATVSLSDSIVAANTAPDCVGTLTDRGYNLSNDRANSCHLGAGRHDLVRTAPKLGPLADNGGPTATRLPQAASPARDVIPRGRAGCVTGATDQRGVSRPRPSGGRCDIGSVEAVRRPKTPPVRIGTATLPGGAVGLPYRVRLTATGGHPPYRWSLASGALPGGLTLGPGGVLSGTPTAAGGFGFTVRAGSATRHLALTVVAGTTRYVAPTGNDGSSAAPNDCSVSSAPCGTVQHAVDVAADGDTVQLAAGTYSQSVTVTDTSLIIAGAAGGSTLQGVTFHADRAAESTPTDLLEHVVLADSKNGGGATAAGVFAALTDVRVVGGGIDVTGGRLRMHDSTIDRLDGTCPDCGVGVVLNDAPARITGSTVTGGGTGIDAGVSELTLIGSTVASVAQIGVTSSARLVIADSTISDNKTDGVRSYGKTTIADSTFTGNGIGRNAEAAVCIMDGHTTIADSTFTGNEAGVLLYGRNTDGPSGHPHAVVRDSTLAGNVHAGLVNSWGGVLTLRTSTVNGNGRLGVLTRGGHTTIADSTIAATRTASGRDGLYPVSAGIAAVPLAGYRTVVRVSGSIVSGDGSVRDCRGTIADYGYNLSHDAANSCRFAARRHDLVHTAAKLGPLADNGGPTATRVPLPGSRARNAIPRGKAGCVAGTTDQRGVHRPQPARGRCDIGAVEARAN